MSGFDQLHSAIQYHIVNSLGWGSLRPLQEQTIAPILAGSNVLACAPTAGGKTEAAILPLFSRMLAEPWQGLSVLYICPLRALLNDLEIRLSRYADLLGRRAAVWHGDTRRAERTRVLREPPQVLLTTPESIEALLTVRPGQAYPLLETVRAVVVDELHAFAADDRGWHLLGVLERLTRVAQSDLQRVGLSATVGNPTELLRWLSGSSVRQQEAVVVEAEGVLAPDVRIDHVGDLANAALVIASLHRGEKRLVFCDSRSRVEALGYELRERGVETYVSHSSLGVEERRLAERAFAEGKDCVIVATSTLELGIDVGDLDRVIQIDAPGTVASFLQRLGRTGRRPGAQRNLLFLTTSEAAFLRACALTRLWQEGYVEPLTPPVLPYHVWAQQLLALVHERSGIGMHEPLALLRELAVAGALDELCLSDVLRYMVVSGILFSDSGVLGLGPEGERWFRGKKFLELLSMISSNALFTVRYGRTEVGSVDEASFLSRDEEGPILLLGGRSWRVNQIDWREREAYVQPFEGKGRSVWPGEGRPLSFEVCQAIRGVLRDAPLDSWLTRRGRELLGQLRITYSWLPAHGTAVTPEGRARLRWWTFGGLKANSAISHRLRSRGLTTLSTDNLSVSVAAESAAEIPEALSGIAESAPSATWLTPAEAEAVMGLKFWFCLPLELGGSIVARRWSDLAAVEAVVAQPLVWVVSASSPSG